MRFSLRGVTPCKWLEYEMSNDKKGETMNDHDGSGKNKGNPGSDATQKTGQQSQDSARHQQDASHHQNDKRQQQGAADHKSAQQSQGETRKESGGTKQSGSDHPAAQKQPSDPGHKGGQSGGQSK